MEETTKIYVDDQPVEAVIVNLSLRGLLARIRVDSTTEPAVRAVHSLLARHQLPFPVQIEMRLGGLTEGPLVRAQVLRCHRGGSRGELWGLSLVEQSAAVDRLLQQLVCGMS